MTTAFITVYTHQCFIFLTLWISQCVIQFFGSQLWCLASRVIWGSTSVNSMWSDSSGQVTVVIYWVFMYVQLMYTFPVDEHSMITSVMNLKLMIWVIRLIWVKNRSESDSDTEDVILERNKTWDWEKLKVSVIVNKW